MFIDLKEKIVIIKVAPKTKVVKESHQPESLIKRYSKVVFELFNIKTNAFNYLHKQTLYSMCQQLYQQVYNKMVQSKPNGIDEVIENSTLGFYEVLNIENLAEKMKHNNIFNVKENLNKIVEHLLISNILYTTEEGEDIEGVDGVVTYLRFNDGNNVSARLKGENCRDPIFDSETFMALRTPMENAKKLSILQVLWFVGGKQLRVSYDTVSSNLLNIHFYRNLSEGDFKNGLKKYWEYESKVISETGGMGRQHA